MSMLFVNYPCVSVSVIKFLRVANKAGVCVVLLNKCVSMGCPALVL